MDKTEYSDEHIITLCIAEATLNKGFRLLMEKYQVRLYWHIRRMVSTHENTDDVLQNAFIKVYKNLSKYRSESKLYTWLYRIATNEAINHLRKEKRNQSLYIDDPDHCVQMLSADEYFDGNLAQKKLVAAINLLPHKQKAVFNLRYYDEMTYSDMSEILGTSIGSLKASYHHAVKKIEKFIKGEG